MSRKPSLRDFTRELPTKDDEHRFRKAMDAESDLVTALVQAVEVDYLLEQAIATRLVRNDRNTMELLCRGNGPLATFSAKIDLAYALGVVDELLVSYLHAVRKIRNAFAHSRKDIYFHTPEVRVEMSKLALPSTKDSGLYKSVDLVRRLTLHRQLDQAPVDFMPLTSRAAYVILCLSIATALRYGFAELDRKVKP